MSMPLHPSLRHPCWGVGNNSVFALSLSSTSSIFAIPQSSWRQENSFAGGAVLAFTACRECGVFTLPCTFPMEGRILLWWHCCNIQQSWLIPAPHSFIKCFVLLDLTSWDHLVYFWLFHYLPLPLISAFPALLCHLQRLALITLRIIKWSA